MPIFRLALIIICALFLVLRVTADVNVKTDGEKGATHRETVMHDLFAVISLSGLYCEQVIDYELINDMDYVAICKSGDRYRVNVTPQGGVNVDTHKSD